MNKQRYSNVECYIAIHSYERFEHIFKIFYFRDHKEHFIDWVNSSKRGIEYISPSIGISPKIIYDWAFSDYLDELELLVEAIIEEINYLYYDSLKVGEFSFRNFKSFCSDYFLKASNILSEKSYFSSEDAYILLTSLLDKYPIHE